eukprot:PhF_6_TR3311/c0_g1_i2/m.4672
MELERVDKIFNLAISDLQDFRFKVNEFEKLRDKILHAEAVRTGAFDSFQHGSKYGHVRYYYQDPKTSTRLMRSNVPHGEVRPYIQEGEEELSHHKVRSYSDPRQSNALKRKDDGADDAKFFALIHRRSLLKAEERRLRLCSDTLKTPPPPVAR